MTAELVAAVVAATRAVIGGTARVPALHEPEFLGREWEFVRDCIDSGWVSSVGAYVDRFELDLARYTGAAYAVATANGTAALHVCLLLVGVRPGDEVLVPALTFIATANAVSYCGAVPHFVDSATDTLGVDPLALESHLLHTTVMQNGVCINRATGRPIRALMPMHTFGHPVRIDALSEVAARFNLAIVEDAAESLGSRYRGVHTGNVGAVAALSFNGNKVVTTGGGGAILTNDAALASRAKHLTTTARVAHRWEFSHDEVGFNYRMPNINAALGCAQLEGLPRALGLKRELARRYLSAFAGIAGVSIFREPAHSESNYWLNALVLDEPDMLVRDAILAGLNGQGLAARPAWTLMHRLPMYADAPRAPLPVAERLEASIVNLPSSPKLAET